MSKNTHTVSCVVCGAKRHRYFCVKDGLEYLQCEGCSHVYVKELIREEDLIKYYADRQSHHGSQEKESWDYSAIKHSNFYVPLLKNIEAKTERGKLLDIGCSNGSFVYAALGKGWEASGIELEESSRRVAEKHGIKVYDKELQKLSFPENHFSAVTLWQVIEHLHNPAKMLHEIKRILKPGGVLAISTPNIRSIAWLLLKDRWGCIEPQVHLNLFTRASLTRLANQCGLCPAKVETLDIKPSTLKDFFSRNHCPNTQSIRVASLAGSVSPLRLKLMFGARALTNIPLKIFGIGEDIFGYFIKNTS